jgi:glycosyltransferase involved in cell wall biosynthesis
MIGPVVKIDPATLPRRPNLHWIGGKQYSELPAYLSGWDVGFMPFGINEATRFISPTKTPEFLAAGLPVVSTRITDVVRPYSELGLVEIADDAAGFEKKISALLRRPKDAWLKAVDRYLAKTSWDKTWRQMEDVIGAASGSGRSRPERGLYEMLEAQSV